MGSTETVQVDVRFVLATNQPLPPLVEAGVDLIIFHVESVAILWVRRPPRSLTIAWSNGEDACVTCRRVMVRFHPGSLKQRSVGVPAAHLRGKEGDRVRFPDGPLEIDGLLVQWEDAWFAPR